MLVRGWGFSGECSDVSIQAFCAGALCLGSVKRLSRPDVEGGLRTRDLVTIAGLLLILTPQLSGSDFLKDVKWNFLWKSALTYFESVMALDKGGRNRPVGQESI